MIEDRYLVYGRSSCPFCLMAVNYLTAQNREFYFFDYPEDSAFLEEAKEFYSFETVPVIVENNLNTGETRIVGGYTDLLDWHRFDGAQ